MSLEPFTVGKNARLVPLMMRISLAASLVLCGLKTGAWLMTGSVAILGAAMDSGLDVIGALFGTVAASYALRPPDSGHGYGHGKAESLAGLFQATIIVSSAVLLLLEAVHHLRVAHPLSHLPLGFGIMAIAVVAAGTIAAGDIYALRRTSSPLLRADAVHYMADLVANAAPLAGLAFATRLPLLDPALAFMIAAFMFAGAADVGWRSVRVLMDHELPGKKRHMIRTIASGHQQVIAIGAMRTRQSGHREIIELELELPPELSLRAAHRIADEVEAKIHEALPNAHVIIHQEPALKFNNPTNS